MQGTLLNESDLVVLHAARELLKRISTRAMQASWDATGEPGTARPVDLGRVAESADVAANAVFQVLNTASSYGHENLTYEQLHNRPDPALAEAV